MGFIPGGRFYIAATAVPHDPGLYGAPRGFFEALATQIGEMYGPGNTPMVAATADK